MKHLRHWLIAAALLSTTHTSVLATEPIEEFHAREISLQALTMSAQLPEQTPGARLGWTDAILASHVAASFKPTETRLGFGIEPVAMDWYGVYLKSLDRVPERNTIYGMLREAPRFDSNDLNAPSALCCQGSGTVSSLERHEKAITSLELSPTFFVFGLLRNKGYALQLDDDWKLQAGVRHMQYGALHQTKLAFFTVERRWTNFRTSYSYQLERGAGTVAPSHVLQVDYHYSPRNSVGVAVTSGREFADFGWLGVMDTEVRNVTVRGQHWFKQDWALTIQAGISDHGSMPAQKGVRIGIRHSF